MPRTSRLPAGQDRHGDPQPRTSRSHRRRLSFRRPHHYGRASPGRQQDHAARRFLDAAQDVQRTGCADQCRYLAGRRQPDRPRQFPSQRDVHAGPHLGMHQPVRSRQGIAVRRRHADARRGDGWRVRIGQHQRLHPVPGAAEGPQFQDIVVGAWPLVRHAAGRCQNRDCAIARAVVGHRRTVSTRSMRGRTSSRSCNRCATSTSSTTPDHRLPV